MTQELARALERQQQIRQARAKSVAAQTAETVARERARTGTPIAGDRVFDLLSGEEGIVIHATTENVIVPTPDR